MSTLHTREIVELTKAHATSDGAGVNLLRVFGGPAAERFDPFLMLDEFGSDKADDYIAGFPPHPHRGFETITYMLKGKMEHRDHLGNVGLLNDGGVQWMTAGSGVIHSEMPKQTEGEMRGFQLWLNLPAAKKMQPARYEDVESNAIPVYEIDGARIKAIAGKSAFNGEEIEGYFNVADTEAQYFDIELEVGTHLRIDTPADHNALVYVFEGEVRTVVAAEHHATIQSQHIARFGRGRELAFTNKSENKARVLVLVGKPLGEPIKQYGPFVMNTAEEIDQAVHDYQNGTLVANQERAIRQIN